MKEAVRSRLIAYPGHALFLGELLRNEDLIEGMFLDEEAPAPDDVHRFGCGSHHSLLSLTPDYWRFSKIPAAPIPPPMHMVTMA